MTRHAPHERWGLGCNPKAFFVPLFFALKKEASPAAVQAALPSAWKAESLPIDSSQRINNIIRTFNSIHRRARDSAGITGSFADGIQPRMRNGLKILAADYSHW
jgi:hypothetical protein